MCFTDLLKYTSLAETKLIEEMGARLIGFGTQFFQSGIIHGMILLLLVFYADKKSVCYMKSILVLCFLFDIYCWYDDGKNNFSGCFNGDCFCYI